VGDQGLRLPNKKDNLLRMDYDKDKVDEMVLALLFLTLHEESRAWKGHDWQAMNRLHEKGMISDPVNKAKSVVLTQLGLDRSRELFIKHFGK
jgi:hypothetical protein